MGWLAALIEGFFRALLERLGKPRKVRQLGGSDALARDVRARIDARRKSATTETYGSRKGRR